MKKRVRKKELRSAWLEHYPFDEWFTDLKRIAVEHYGFTRESAETLDPDAFRDYYDAVYSPQVALVVDLSHV